MKTNLEVVLQLDPLSDIAAAISCHAKDTHVVTLARTHTHKDNPATVNIAAVYLLLLFSVSAVGGGAAASIDSRGSPRLPLFPQTLLRFAALWQAKAPPLKYV